MSNEITFNAKLSEAPRTQGDFTYKITPHGVFDWRHRLGLVPGNRGYRGGLTRDRVLPLSLDHKVQDHVPGRKGFWQVHWDGKSASLFALQETDERRACKKLWNGGEAKPLTPRPDNLPSTR